MATSTSTDGWLPPHLRIIQSQSRFISETNSISPEGSLSISFQAFNSYQDIQPDHGKGGVSLSGNPSSTSRYQSAPINGHQTTPLSKEETTAPHPCIIIEQKKQPQLPPVTAQQWKASLTAHLEKYQSKTVPKAPRENVPPMDATKVSSEKSELSFIAPHLRALSSISVSASSTHAETPTTSSCARQENVIQPENVSDSTDLWIGSPLGGSTETSPIPRPGSINITSITKTQSFPISKSPESYLEASSTELDLLPAHLRVLQPTPTPAPSRLTKEHLAALEQMTVTTNISVGSASSVTTTQMARKPKIDKGKGREVQLPLPAPPPILPPAMIRTGDAASWTKRTDAPELMKMSKDYPCPYEDCRLGFVTLKAIRRHKAEKHDYCKKCDKDFKDAQDYLDHKIESSEHITCPVCGEDFRSNGGRDVHIHTVCQLSRIATQN